MFCGKCGANIPDGYEFCMECGAKIDVSSIDATEVNIVEAKAKKKKINKKVLIPVIVAAGVILAAVAIVFGMKCAVERNGYFANIPWGTDVETVQEKVNKTFKCESIVGKNKDSIIATIENYDGMQGVNALFVLDCKEKGLNKVGIMFTIKDGSRYTEEKIADELIGKYNKLFGAADNIGGNYKWKTKNSTIELVILTKDLIMLNFEK